jgi:RNA polymerase sigma factor (sigma-70 family)
MVAAQNRVEHFRRMVMPHLDGAYNLARWLCRNDHDAEDIVQEACLRAFKYFDSFHGDNARAWLLSIVRNATWTWIQENRRHELSTSFDDELHSSQDGASVTILHPDNNPETILARQDDRGLVNQALEALPIEFREALVLRELEEMSYKEIAEVAGVPMGTVMSRLARGRRLLGEQLQRLAKESPSGLQRNQGPAVRPRG